MPSFTASSSMCRTETSASRTHAALHTSSAPFYICGRVPRVRGRLQWRAHLSSALLSSMFLRSVCLKRGNSRLELHMLGSRCSSCEVHRDVIRACKESSYLRRQHAWASRDYSSSWTQCGDSEDGCKQPLSHSLLLAFMRLLVYLSKLHDCRNMPSWHIS